MILIISNVRVSFKTTDKTLLVPHLSQNCCFSDDIAVQFSSCTAYVISGLQAAAPRRKRVAQLDSPEFN